MGEGWSNIPKHEHMHGGGVLHFSGVKRFRANCALCICNMIINVCDDEWLSSISLLLYFQEVLLSSPRDACKVARCGVSPLCSILSSLDHGSDFIGHLVPENPAKGNRRQKVCFSLCRARMPEASLIKDATKGINILSIGFHHHVVFISADSPARLQFFFL